jgi:hypothetical protein
MHAGFFLGYGGASTNGIHATCEFVVIERGSVRAPQDAISHFTSLHLSAAQAPPDGIQHIIWAFSRTPPESADPNANFSMHHAFGSTTLNLTRTAVLSDDAAAPVPPSSEADKDESTRPSDGDTPSKSTTPADGITTGARSGGFASFVHAGLCMAGFLLVIPTGALVVRYAKLTGSPAAFNLHRNLQFGVGAFASGPFLAHCFLDRRLYHSPMYGINVLVSQRACPSRGACSRTSSWTTTALVYRIR